jgi:hypothetical protein
MAGVCREIAAKRPWPSRRRNPTAHAEAEHQEHAVERAADRDRQEHDADRRWTGYESTRRAEGHDLPPGWAYIRTDVRRHLLGVGACVRCIVQMIVAMPVVMLGQGEG